jgi:hypothetical protein
VEVTLGLTDAVGDTLDVIDAVEVTLGLTDAVGDTLDVIDAVGDTLELGLTLIVSDDVEDIDIEGLNIIDSVGVMLGLKLELGLRLRLGLGLRLELGLELRVIDDEGDGDAGIKLYERDTMGSPFPFGEMGTGFWNTIVRDAFC